MQYLSYKQRQETPCSSSVRNDASLPSHNSDDDLSTSFSLPTLAERLTTSPSRVRKSKIRTICAQTQNIPYQDIQPYRTIVNRIHIQKLYFLFEYLFSGLLCPVACFVCVLIWRSTNNRFLLSMGFLKYIGHLSGVIFRDYVLFEHSWLYIQKLEKHLNIVLLVYRRKPIALCSSMLRPWRKNFV